jgi:type I restriction enzyme M protein
MTDSITTTKSITGTARIQSIEQHLWQAADKLRSNMDAAEYKHVVLGLIFLKYISDSFAVRFEQAKVEGFDPEDRDWYLAENIFWVPQEARWSLLQDNAKQPTIGVIIDSAMDAIERDNPSLKGVLPKNYARESLDKRRLGELIDVFSAVSLSGSGHQSKDLLGQIYEYFIGMFADAEGKRGGQFYTPKSIVKVLVAMLQPYKGRIYDPCCGSGGMFAQSEKFVEEHQGRIGDISVYGQESNQTTWKLAKMNMAIRGIEADIKYGDTLHDDQLKDLKADFILANPPFNVSDWGGELLRNDVRWVYGTPPTGNANFAWVQHFIHHLSPNGTAGFVLANGSMSSQSSGEGEIRRKMVEAGVVDCIVTLPAQLFFNTGIPACLWFVSRNRENRKDQVLFIDARNLGHMINRRNKELTDSDIAQITDTYHNWRRTNGGEYEDVVGFCKAATIAEIADQDFILTPGRYVGSEAVEDNDEAFKDKMAKLTAELKDQFTQSHDLEAAIKKNLEKIGYEL